MPTQLLSQPFDFSAPSPGAAQHPAQARGFFQKLLEFWVRPYRNVDFIQVD